MPKRSSSKGSQLFLHFFSACSYLYLTQSTFLSVLTWPARNMSDGSNSMAETKPEEYHPHSLNLPFVRISPPRVPSLSPTCRFIVEVEECHFCSENIGRWTGVITAPLNHLTLAVMGLQEGGVKTQMPFYTPASSASLTHS